MTTPRLGAPELTLNQAVPETTVNEQIRYVEQGASRIIVKDKDLATPPGSPADGDAYIVAGSPTGAWSAWAGYLAFYMNTAWEPIIPIEGTKAYAQDENVEYMFDGSAWNPSSSVIASTVSSQSGTSYTAVLADANTYVRFTNGSAISFTIPPNSSVVFPIGTVIEVEQAGAGALSFVAGSGVTLNSRSADLTLAGQYAVAFAKKVATDTWTINGDL